MGLIPEDFVAKVREGANIVDVARQFMDLKQSGRSYKALCPFHQEKTPSFHVHSDRQMFHCFGCGKGGNVFTLLMELEGMTFPDAVRYLAERQGLAMPETGESPEQSGKRKQMLALNERVAAQYHANLAGKKGAAARAYLVKRGIAVETQDQFRLGYATADWDGVAKTLHGDDIEHALALGLIRPRKEGKGYYDLFRERLMFPIVDIHERVIGMGGRKWQESQADEPKYINSSDSPVYNKSASLFGLVHARKALQQEGAAVLMEGYTDVILAHQGGVKNAVAALGTALTETHGNILKRYVPRVILCYDPDLAGINATVRGIHILLGLGLEVAVAQLPGDDDPADYVLKHGGAALKKELGNAQDFFAYHFALLKQQFAGQGVAGKEKIVAGVLPTVAATAEPIRRDEYLRILAGDLRVDERILRAKLAKLGQERAAEERRTAARREPAAADPLALAAATSDATERELARLMARHPALAEEFGPAARALTFVDQVAREAVDAMAAGPLADRFDTLTAAAQGLVTAAAVTGRRGAADDAEESETAHAQRLLDETDRAREALRRCLAEMRRREVEEKLRASEQKLAACEGAGDAAGAAAALEEIGFWNDVLLPPDERRAELEQLRRSADDQEQFGDTAGQARTQARIRRLEKIIQTEATA